MKERKARGGGKVLRLVSLRPHSHNFHNPHNSHNLGLPQLPRYSEEVDIEKLNTIHQDLFGLMVEVQRVLQAGTGVIIKMQGRKKHHYLEKEVSDLKNSMSMIKKKKEI